MTTTYTDKDVSRYASAIIDSKYPQEQAGPLKTLIDSLLTKELMELDIDVSETANNITRRMVVSVEYPIDGTKIGE